MKNLKLTFQAFLFFLFCTFFCGCTQNQKNTSVKQHEYIVAAYIWPSCHDDPLAREKLWSEGIGEWEMVQKGDQRFEGHYQPRIPFWGYEPDDDPKVMEKWIEAASDHGVNTFIFDWYWYDGQPFLEGSVNAFVKATNTEKMNFYLMWANHDVPGNMWNCHRYSTDSLIWEGSVDEKNFRIIVDRVINQYFKCTNYLKINGEPVFSLYNLNNFIKSFKDVEGAKQALTYFRDRVKEAGFPGLHLQLVAMDNTWDFEGWGTKDINGTVSAFDAGSVTFYNMHGNRRGDYLKYGINALALREQWDSQLTTPFFPCVSVGWDDTPRRPLKGKEQIIYINNTPESFACFLQKAKEYADNRPDQPKMVVINAWNEWIEGSYLMPDMKDGFGYLEAVRDVFIEKKYDRYK